MTFILDPNNPAVAAALAAMPPKRVGRRKILPEHRRECRNERAREYTARKAAERKARIAAGLPAKTPEQVERDRERSRRYLEKIKARIAAGLPVPPSFSAKRKAKPAACLAPEDLEKRRSYKREYRKRRRAADRENREAILDILVVLANDERNQHPRAALREIRAIISAMARWRA